MAMDHPLSDQAELYVVGALTPAERAEFEAHLPGCAACAAEVRALAPVAAALAYSAPADRPSSAVRSRLMARIGGRASQVRPTGWLAAAASIVVAVALGAYAAQLRGRITSLEAQLREARLRADAGDRQVADARRAANEAQSMIAILTAPDVAQVDLAGQAAAPGASGRAYWSRSRGLVINASNLPPLPPGRTYQMWVITAQPAPTSAGLLKPDANGRASAVFETPVDIPTPTAMAVTIEPEGGVPAPTGAMYLVGQAH
jgi:anti-sigma-K factor RskA